ncbi:MAG: PQQ-binding-like beta-propeller repeat protein [Bryobacterales bacterium]|nr:PQQ-binding-like beta-propeller repeat protein [Bryobacterales bacterium]
MERCAVCHGQDATGSMAVNLVHSRTVLRGSDEALFMVIRKGLPGAEMAPQKDLSDEQVAGSYEYIHEGTGKGYPKSWNRGFALSGDRLFMGAFDCHQVALDARSGAEIWRSQVAEKDVCFGSTSAPLVVRNRVMIGSRGGDSGKLRGSLSGFDAGTGRRVWRFYTVPEPGERGSETWSSDSDAWKGGGAPWGTGTYDPELNLLYWPTRNAGPKDFDGRNRPGDNLYTASLLAMDPDTGERKWHYQFSPHDEHDWDATQTPLLVDTEWEGRPRKLLVEANRNGLFYVLDRTNEEFLLGEAFAKQTWAERIGTDGRPVLAHGQAPSTKESLVCPDVHGGTNWHVPSYSPLTGLLYVPLRDTCWIDYRTGHSETTARQFLRAIDIKTGEKRWGSRSWGTNHRRSTWRARWRRQAAWCSFRVGSAISSQRTPRRARRPGTSMPGALFGPRR